MIWTKLLLITCVVATVNYWAGAPLSAAVITLACTLVLLAWFHRTVSDACESKVRESCRYDREYLLLLCEQYLPLLQHNLKDASWQSEHATEHLIKLFTRLSQLLNEPEASQSGEKQGRVRELISEIITELQYQDRVSQILSASVRASGQTEVLLSHYLSGNDDQPPDLKAVLHELQQPLLTGCHRRSHSRNDSDEPTFF